MAARRRFFSSATAAAHYLADCRTGAARQRIVHGDGTAWPTTIAEAYETQRLLHKLLGENENGGSALVGHKVGCTTKVMQEYLSVPHPCAGGIQSTGIWHAEKIEQPDGCVVDMVKVDAQRFVRLGVECELAVVLGEDLPAGDAARSRAPRVRLAPCTPRWSSSTTGTKTFASGSLQCSGGSQTTSSTADWR